MNSPTIISILSIRLKIRCCIHHISPYWFHQQLYHYCLSGWKSGVVYIIYHHIELTNNYLIIVRLVENPVSCTSYFTTLGSPTITTLMSIRLKIQCRVHHISPLWVHQQLFHYCPFGWKSNVVYIIYHNIEFTNNYFIIVHMVENPVSCTSYKVETMLILISNYIGNSCFVFQRSQNHVFIIFC